jgi:hypothetical protein
MVDKTQHEKLKDWATRALLAFFLITLFACYMWVIRVVVFNATFNNISVISRRSVVLVEEAGDPGENHIHCILIFFFFLCQIILLLIKQYIVLNVSLKYSGTINGNMTYLFSKWIKSLNWAIYWAYTLFLDTTDLLDITEILLKVALNTTTLITHM